jgi:hypothetical protein
MALLSKTIIATTAFAIISSQALSQACWEFKSGMTYWYGGPGNWTAAALGESYSSKIMKYATKVPENTVFFMVGGVLYSASGMPNPLGEIHQE